MCAVSATHDYMRTRVPVTKWTRPMFDEYQEIIRRLTALDAKLDQPDCEDPSKAAWMREVEDRLTAIENEKVS